MIKTMFQQAIRRIFPKFQIIVIVILAFMCWMIYTPHAKSFPSKEKQVNASVFVNFSSAMTDPRSAGKTIIVSTTYAVNGLTIPPDRKLQIVKGGEININHGGTLTINAPFKAGLYKVFGGDGIAKFGKGSAQEVYPQWWGAIADGSSDCYASIKAMAASISASKGGKVVFPKGTYFIEPYKNKFNRNRITDIIFNNCTGLHISGKGAKINVNGKFYRAADVLKGGFLYSNSNSITPFWIENCSNIIIDGLEVNGNASQMNRDKRVVESPGHGIVIEGGSGFVLKNLYVHHFQSDGIYLTGNIVKGMIYPCRNGSLYKVISTNNARQGLSIVQARDITCTECVFADTGKTGGEYGNHSPSAGVDIEPIYYINSHLIKASVNTGNIIFFRCRFENNMGSQFVAAVGQSTDLVTLKDCIINAKQSSFRYPVILGVNGGTIENCTIDTGNGSVNVGWRHKSGKIYKTTIKACKIRTRANGIVCVNNLETIIENNIIINYFDAAEPYHSTPYINNPNCIFSGNYVFIPKELFSGDKNLYVASHLNVNESSNNIFDTDLVPIKNEHFAIIYGNNTLVVNDSYGPRGSLRAFRAYSNANWNNIRAYLNKPL